MSVDGEVCTVGPRFPKLQDDPHLKCSAAWQEDHNVVTLHFPPSAAEYMQSRAWRSKSEMGNYPFM